MDFLERIGKKPVRVAIQMDSVDGETRAALWNSSLELLDILTKSDPYQYSIYTAFLTLTWTDFWHQPADEYHDGRVKARLKEVFLKGEWHDVLHTAEWLVRATEEVYDRTTESLRERINGTFEHNLIGYRIVGRDMIAVTEPAELEAIELALTGSGSAAKAHLNRAVELLSNRRQPQYAKVISESIHAVEATVRELTGENVLSVGLKKLDDKGYALHPALREGWDKLYGYTSDAAGIRHALVRDEDADEPLAVYFLVACSGFVNLLLKIHTRAGS